MFPIKIRGYNPLYNISLFFGVTFFTFLALFYFGPDMAYQNLGKKATQKDLEREREKLGYNKSMINRYGLFLHSYIIDRDLGYSLSTNQDIKKIFNKAIPVSEKIILPGFFLGHLLSFALALLFATSFRKSFFTKFLMGISLCPIILVIIIEYLFWSNGKHPVQNWNIDDPSSYIVPNLCFLCLTVSYSCRFYYITFVEKLTQQTDEKSPKATEIIMSSMGSIIGHVLLSLPFIAVCSLFVESYFNISGIGAVLFDAVIINDTPIVQAAITYTTIWIVFSLILADIAYVLFQEKHPSTEYKNNSIETGPLWKNVLTRFKHNKIGIASTAIISIFIIIALGAQFGLWASNWNELQVKPQNTWFGVNQLGQDIFSRAVYSTKTAFSLGLYIALQATLLGVFIGCLCGFFRKSWFDKCCMWCIRCLHCFPIYFFVIAISSILYSWDTRPTSIYIAMTTVFWIPIAKCVRKEIIKWQSLKTHQHNLQPPASDTVFRIAYTTFIQATFVFTNIIKLEVALAYIGHSVLNTVSWGKMIAESTTEIHTGAYNNFKVAIFFLIPLTIALGLFARALQNSLDPKTDINNFS